MNDNTQPTLAAWLDQINGMRDAGMLDDPDHETVRDLNEAAFALMHIVARMSKRARETARETGG